MIGTLSPFVSSGPKNAIFRKDYILEPKKTYYLFITFNDNDSLIHNEHNCPQEGAAGWASMGLPTTFTKSVNMCLSSVISPQKFKFNDVIYTRTKGNKSYYNKYDVKNLIIHEFCHSLGMEHEHQNDIYAGGLVYENMIYPPIDTEAHNFIKHSCQDGIDNCKYIGSKYDSDSLMHYRFDPMAELKFYLMAELGDYLSVIDEEWLQKIYPIKDNSDDYPIIEIYFVDGSESSTPNKKYVEAVITETFLELIGVNYIIYGYRGVPPVKYIAKTTNKGPLIIIGNITKNFKPYIIINDEYKMQTLDIVILMIALIILVFIVKFHYT